MPGNLARACAEFNEGKFFECHETLEEIWQEEQGDVRDLYKGLIQVAAAFVHITRGNYVGADRLFTTSLGYLSPYRAGGAMGFDVDAFCLATAACHDALVSRGKDEVVFDPGAVPHLACDLVVLPAEARRWRAWGFDREGHAPPMTITVFD